MTFLTPSLTAIVAAVFLGEKLSLKIIAAGCTQICSYNCSNYVDSLIFMLVCSFLGVILIARPPLIFGDPAAEVDSDDSPSRHVTPEQRLAAVG